MIDIRLLRTDPDRVRESLSRRGIEIDLGELIAFDARNRELLGEVEKLRAEQNRVGREISAAKGEAKQSLIDSMKEVSDRLGDLERELDEVKADLMEGLARVPNVIHPDVPRGLTEDDNRVVREVGHAGGLGFDGRDHLEIGENLGIIDVERAAKVSGSRFGFLLREAVLLEFALVRYAFDRLIAEGFAPVIPPVLVRQEAMFGTGFFPTDEAQVYRIERDDLYLVGTSEVSMASMHSGEIFPAESLPIRYAGFSTCFRREAGTYGKDTRGIIRVHQFDKVEMFSFVHPDRSEEEHRRLIELEEEVVGSLEIPYRLVEHCAGDLSASHFRSYDIEAWLPGSARWMEITTCSNCSDYQARRLGVRTKVGGTNVLVHTLNGTIVAVGRTLVALLENHQRKDGSVGVPSVLQPYTGFGSIERG